MKIRCFCWIVMFACSAIAAGPAREVRSPDGKIAVTIHTDAPLGYSITVDGKPLLVRSRLGLELEGNVNLGEKPAAELLMRAVEQVCAAGILSPDLGGTATTKEVTAAVVEAVRGRLVALQHQLLVETVELDIRLLSAVQV